MKFEALGLARAGTDAIATIVALGAAGRFAFRARDFATARRYAEQAAAMSRERGAIVLELRYRGDLAACHDNEGNATRAIDEYRRCIEESWRHRFLYTLVVALWNACRPLSHSGRHAIALRTVVFAMRYWEGAIGAITWRDRRYVARIRRGARLALGRELACAEMRAGWTTSLEAAVADALSALSPPPAPVSAVAPPDRAAAS